MPFTSIIILLFPMFAVGYFLLWFRYANTYAGMVAQPRVWKTLLVGVIGVWPNVLFMRLIALFKACLVKTRLCRGLSNQTSEVMRTSIKFHWKSLFYSVK
jgi:hypothetical protein